MRSFYPEKLPFFDNLELIVIELDAEDMSKPEFSLAGWEKIFEKVYGGTAVFGFRKK